jgi:hypothetical protein
MSGLKRFGVIASSGSAEPTLTPTTAVVDQQLNSVSFSITNTNPEAVDIT